MTSECILGIDVGTSAVKSVFLDAHSGALLDLETASYPLSSPRPLFSEADPADWFAAVVSTVSRLSSRHPGAVVRGIGLTGQMHSVVLLGESDEVLHPAILWNDGRCAAEAEELESRVPDWRARLGGRLCVGFTAPKLLWVQRHLPAVWARTRRVLVCKDWIRYRLTGALFSDVSEASGTGLLDVRRRAWCPLALAACGVSLSQLPTLCEGTDLAGVLLPSAARLLGLPPGIPLVGGAGDQAAGALGSGVSRAGATLSLGTGGVLLRARTDAREDPLGRLHAFAHAIPGAWIEMGVSLCAGGSLQWFRDTFCPGEPFADLMREAECAKSAGGLLFLPYLNGERTPLFDERARGAFVGLTRGTTRGDMARAVLEGVCLAFRSIAALVGPVAEFGATGGATKAPFWMQMLADCVGAPVVVRGEAQGGAAAGAARLVMVGVMGMAVEDAFTPEAVVARYEPRPGAYEAYARVHQRFCAVYEALAQSYFHQL